MKATTNKKNGFHEIATESARVLDGINANSDLIIESWRSRLLKSDKPLNMEAFLIEMTVKTFLNGMMTGMALRTLEPKVFRDLELLAKEHFQS